MKQGQDIGLVTIWLVLPVLLTMSYDTQQQVPQDALRRLQAKKQTLDDAYAEPANFLEIDIVNPMTHGVDRNRYTDYEVRMRVSFKFICVPLFIFHLITE